MSACRCVTQTYYYLCLSLSLSISLLYRCWLSLSSAVSSPDVMLRHQMHITNSFFAKDRLPSAVTSRVVHYQVLLRHHTYINYQVLLRHMMYITKRQYVIRCTLPRVLTSPEVHYQVLLGHQKCIIKWCYVNWCTLPSNVTTPDVHYQVLLCHQMYITNSFFTWCRLSLFTCFKLFQDTNEPRTKSKRTKFTWDKEWMHNTPLKKYNRSVSSGK